MNFNKFKKQFDKSFKKQKSEDFINEMETKGYAFKVLTKEELEAQRNHNYKYLIP